jgi:hypothetical protein
VYRAAPARARTAPDPLFIIGHWRSGTTLLHELLCLDPRHAGPTVYECCAPHHFLLTGNALPRLLPLLLPDKRPVDGMDLEWGSVFEDEFALCLLGARSPYEHIAFPNDATFPLEQFDPRELGEDEERRWRAALVRFFEKLTIRYPERRLVFKSPPHTCRIRVLLEMFPLAQFVHIVRNPVDVFLSTKHLWNVLHRTQGLQSPDREVAGERVVATLLHLHACVERDRAFVPAGQFHEMRYEHLIRDPVDEMRRLYGQLDIGGFANVQPRVETEMAARATYTRSRYEMAEAELDRVRQRLGTLMERYGYPDRPRSRIDGGT